MPGQQRGMHVDAAVLRDVEDAFGQDLAVSDDHDQIGSQRLEFGDDIGERTSPGEFDGQGGLTGGLLDRLRLLGRISDLLAPGGHLVLDLNGPGAFDAVGDHVEIEQRLMGGFFAAGDYVGIHKPDVYEDEWLSLDRFVVIEPDACWQLFNWTQYYTPESAVAELAEGGFMVAAMTGGLDGTPLAEDSQVLGIIAEAS